MFDETSTVGGDILGNQDGSLNGFDGTFTTDKIYPKDPVNGYSFTDPFSGLHSYNDSLFINGYKQGHRAIGSWGGQKSFVTMQFAPYDDSSGSSVERKTFARNLEVLDSINDAEGGNGVFDFALQFTVNTSRSTENRYNLELFKIGAVSEKDTAAPSLDSLKSLNKALSINYATVSGNSSAGSIPISLDYHSTKSQITDTLIYFKQTKTHSYVVETFADTIYKHNDSSIFIYGDTAVSTPVEVSQIDEAFEASILPYDGIVAYQLPYNHQNYFALEDSLHLTTESVTDIENIKTTTHKIGTYTLYHYSNDTTYDTLKAVYPVIDFSKTIVGVDTVYKDTTIYFYSTKISKVKGDRLSDADIAASFKELDTLIERVGDKVTLTDPKDSTKLVNARRSTIFYPAHEYRKAASVISSVTDTIEGDVIRTIYHKEDTIFTYPGNVVTQDEIVDTINNISIDSLTIKDRAGAFTHIDSVFYMALDFSDFQKDSSLLYLSGLKIHAKLTVNENAYYNDFPVSMSQMTVIDSNDSTLNSNMVPVSDGGTQRFARLKLNMPTFWNTIQKNQYRTILYSDLKLLVDKVELPNYHNDTIVVKGLLLDTLYHNNYATSNFLAQNREDRIPFTFSVVKDSSSVLIDNQTLTDNLLDVLYGERYKNLPANTVPECYLYLWIEDGHLGRVYWDYPKEAPTLFTYILQDKK